ncbi:SMP-30/gluconolactonase/LRE family protein [Candidatus Aquiluna sp. UB-MaderosW2red]|uniref:SMP-30/gluconolactonase/LRE family protein n=1 Tax=Candidatus Aquiluna sp. UB-MaderosW2red TaxID=1855377 RepID=UPI000875B96D|nr:SMP-30/gluconolactonase/LRE family protein [Candidatus Aquiluna sp. UB-MaderosW2red]SCX05279.1 Sugar lactone lactonase YvrE [Candidatus Aquiluna sp. UB-MaderosW2red]
MNDRLQDVVTGMRFPEGNRWRDGKLWFSDMHTGEVFVLDPVHEDTPRLLTTLDCQSSGLGWLLDGRFIVSAMNERVLRTINEDGTTSIFADLTKVSESLINDLMVDAETGRTYVGAFGYDVYGGEEAKTGPLYVVEPDGSARLAADGFVFPNSANIVPGTRTLVLGETWGHVMTAFDILQNGNLDNRRIWAQLPEGTTPDGSCVDLEGGIWISSLETGEFLRVLEGGEITDRIEVPGRCAIDCVLGGDDGRTLFISTADSYMPAVTERTRDGKIQAVRVSVAGPV